MTIDDVIRGHDAPRMRFFDDDLELLQVDLADGTFRSTGIGILAVELFIVQRQMLRRCRDMLALDAAHQGGSLLTGQQRIL